MPLLYSLDPRAKLMFILLLTTLVFFIDRLSVIFCLLLSFIIIRILSKIPFQIIKYLKNLSLLAFFIIIIQTLFFPGENYILNPLFPPSFPVLGGFGSLKWEGFFFGLVIACRLSALFILFPVFTRTTTPESLAVSLQALGLNYRAAFVMSYTFSLIPLFREEALTVMDAQKLRGIRSFEKGFFPARLKAFAGLVLPLVLGAMRKARSSSIAMDSRAFGVYKTRTMLEKPEMKMRDFLFIFGCIAFCVCFLFWNY